MLRHARLHASSFLFPATVQKGFRATSHPDLQHAESSHPHRIPTQATHVTLMICGALGGWLCVVVLALRVCPLLILPSYAKGWGALWQQYVLITLGIHRALARPSTQALARYN